VAALALGAAPATATFPGSTGKLAWSQEGLVHVGDRIDPRQPPRVIGPGEDPRWSPDGTRIASVGQWKDTTALFVMNADGSGRRQLTRPVVTDTVPFEMDHAPSWSPEGSRVAYVRERHVAAGSNSSDVFYQVRILNTQTGADSLVATYGQGVTNHDTLDKTDWSPDGSRIALELSDGGPLQARLLVLSLQGGGATVVPRSRKFWHSWSPKGDTLAIADWSGRAVDLLAPNGSRKGSIPLPGGRGLPYDAGVRFLPDGAHVAVHSCANGDCDTRRLQVPDDTLDFDRHAPQQEKLEHFPPHTGSDYVIGDLQPAKHPIVFVHGYAGSELACGNSVHWVGLKPSLDKLLLAEDGDSAAPGQCAVRPVRALRSAFTKDVYGSTFKALENMAPGRVHDFAWDWRRDPRLQMSQLRQAIRRALEDDLSKRQDLDEVVLVGHSFGGLFIRAALAETDIERQVRRVMTVGTPYWGSAKAIFPLCCGVESPLFSPLDILISNQHLRAFARNNTGNYWLYPSAPYGPWLQWDGGKQIGGAAVGSVVKSLGGSMTAFGRAVDAHQKLDGFRKLRPDGLREVRVVVGTGLPTISSASFSRGLRNVILGFESGDGTVTGKSGSQGPIGTTDPMGEDVPISYVCGIEHVPLPGHPGVVDPYKDYIRYGTPPAKTRGCHMRGAAFTISPVEVLGDASAARAAAASRTLTALRRAERAGRIDLLELPNQIVVVADARSPFQLKVPLEGMSVSAQSLGENGAGKPVRFGGMKGTGTLGAGPSGAVDVKLGGKAPPRGALKLTAKPAKARLAAVLRGGLAVDARCSRACSAAARLVIPAGTARKVGLTRSREAHITVGRASGNLAAGRVKKLRVRVGGKHAKRLRKVRSVKAVVVLSASDKAGRFGSVSRKLTLR
jgi:pimeloyl-ACP methyl ester carboxylesterase